MTTLLKSQKKMATKTVAMKTVLRAKDSSALMTTITAGKKRKNTDSKGATSEK